MRALVLLLSLLGLGSGVTAQPVIIAHRGASAERPEHTMAAYRLAIEQGADFIEPDLVSTKDGVLVARHENEISTTTDVADHPAFAARRTTKTIDGMAITGWFTEDFTLAELQTLKARERLPQLRPGNMAWNDKEAIPTFDAILALALAEGKRLNRPIGVYPETKHPSHFRQIGLPLEEKLLAALTAHGLNSAEAPVFIQSFEVGNLQMLRGKTRVRLVQLVAGEYGPADKPGTTYTQMLTPAGLARIATYADAIGAERNLIIPRDGDALAKPSALVQAAHKAGLKVHVWTFRPENYFLPAEYRKGASPMAIGNAAAEIRAFIATGIDGYFSDSVAAAVSARSAD